MDTSPEDIQCQQDAAAGLEEDGQDPPSPNISSGPATVACGHFQQLPARAWRRKKRFHFKRIVCRMDDPDWCAFCSLVFFFCSSFWFFSPSLSQPSKMTEWWIILTVVTSRTMNLSLSFCVYPSVLLDLMLLSLSIDVFKFEFSLFLSLCLIHWVYIFQLLLFDSPGVHFSVAYCPWSYYWPKRCEHRPCMLEDH